MRILGFNVDVFRNYTADPRSREASLLVLDDTCNDRVELVLTGLCTEKTSDGRKRMSTVIDLVGAAALHNVLDGFLVEANEKSKKGGGRRAPLRLNSVKDID